MSFETILYDESDHVATITLHRPDRLNAITKQLGDELLEAMRTADRNDAVRVIVLTGSGRGFCAGADMSSLSGIAQKDDWSPEDSAPRPVTPRPFEDAIDDFRKPHSYFPAVSKPVIGAVNGVAVGLGFVYLLYCDIRIASEKARFGTAFSQRGLIAEHGISWMLPRLIGISHALDMLYSARLVDAQEALRMGLVSRVVAHDELMDQVTQYAAMLVTTVSPRSLRVIKKQVYEAQFKTLGEAIDVADEEMIQSLQCDDFKEGVAHFVEKRPPRFSGT